MELACLGTDQRRGSILPSIGAGEQVLKALHGCLHILKQEAVGILRRLKFAMQNSFEKKKRLENQKENLKEKRRRHVCTFMSNYFWNV